MPALHIHCHPHTNQKSLSASWLEMLLDRSRRCSLTPRETLPRSTCRYYDSRNCRPQNRPLQCPADPVTSAATCCKSDLRPHLNLFRPINGITTSRVRLLQCPQKLGLLFARRICNHVHHKLGGLFRNCLSPPHKRFVRKRFRTSCILQTFV